jgi:hypothetical protein
MATKAELEIELAELRRQLAERDNATDDSSESAEPVKKTVSETAEEWEAIITEVVKEIEDLPLKRPLLVAAGIFAFGWLIGRSSR